MILYSLLPILPHYLRHHQSVTADTHIVQPAWLWHHTGVLGNLYGSVSGQKGCLESRNCGSGSGSGFSCGKNRQGESSWPVVVK